MTRLYVRVHPDSDAFRTETDGRFPEVYVEAPAEDGRANHELTARLTEVLGVKVGIVSGHSSRRKKVAVDLPETEVMERLAAV